MQQCKREKPTGSVSDDTNQETDETYENVKRLLSKMSISDSMENEPLSWFRGCVMAAEDIMQQLDVSAKKPVTDTTTHVTNGAGERLSTEYEEASNLAKRLDWCRSQLDAYLSNTEV